VVKAKVESKQIIGVLVDLNEGAAIKFIAYRGFDKLLCSHVYFGFCPQCSQYECEKRSV